MWVEAETDPVAGTVRRGRTGHRPNKAFERYLMADKTEGLTVSATLKKLQDSGKKGEVVDFKFKKPKK
jgi:hypothetical protein